MVINPIQLKIFQSVAIENFTYRVAEHLRTNYAKSSIFLPSLASFVEELPLETLRALVHKSISCAKNKGFKSEASIAVFSAMMFDVSPNFDKHPLIKDILHDEDIEVDKRIYKLLDILTEDDWAVVKEGYDINAWQHN